MRSRFWRGDWGWERVCVEGVEGVEDGVRDIVQYRYSAIHCAVHCSTHAPTLHTHTRTHAQRTINANRTGSIVCGCDTEIVTQRHGVSSGASRESGLVDCRGQNNDPGSVTRRSPKLDFRIHERVGETGGMSCETSTPRHVQHAET